MDPYAELISTRALIARRYEDTQNLPPAALPQRTVPAAVPVDIYEDPDGFRVTAELPGADPRSLEVTVVDNVLSIRGQIQLPAGPPPHTYRHRSPCCGPVARDVPLPKPVSGDEAAASFRDGVLVVTVPKAAAAPAHIPVKPPGE